MSVLISIASFIVALGLLVAVHEFGHFWVAKKLGVKVLRFSIGFGKPIYSRVFGEDKSEFVIAAIPLGGYVKMLDEREGDVAEEERHRAFNTQSVWTRFAIVFAGPLFNFLFAILVYFLMYSVGVNGVRPYVGEVMPNTVAEASGLQERDLIQRVNGEDVDTWEQVRLRIIDEVLDKRDLQLSVVTRDGEIQERFLATADLYFFDAETDQLEVIGFKSWRPYKPMIGQVMADSPAKAAGLEKGDRILSVNGQQTESIVEFIDFIQASSGQSLDFEILRDERVIHLMVVPGEKRNDEGELIGFIGAGVGGYLTEEMRDLLRIEQRFGPLSAIGFAMEKTWDMSVLTLRMMGKLITGEASLKNVSGPITIAEYAGVSAVVGLAAFLAFLGMISISLGVLNLLPIPLLDGGHLLYYLIEIVKGSPVSEQFEAIGQRIGLSLIAMLMLLAFYNDLSRVFGS